MRISDWSSDVCSSDLREAAFRDAEAREREAEAEAKATAMVSEAIARGDVNAVNYFVAQRYVDALGKFADSANQKTFFLPLEATSLIGAVGGIAEIARDAMQQREARRGPWERSEEHTSALQSLMRISYAVFCFEKDKQQVRHQ